ncbi:hypothetical protein D3C80_1471880 [compost metagenome]
MWWASSRSSVWRVRPGSVASPKTKAWLEWRRPCSTAERKKSRWKACSPARSATAPRMVARPTLVWLRMVKGKLSGPLAVSCTRPRELACSTVTPTPPWKSG